MDSSSFPSSFIRLWGPRAVRRPLQTEVAALPAPRLLLRALLHWHISQHAPGREGGAGLNGDERKGEG